MKVFTKAADALQLATAALAAGLTAVHLIRTGQAVWQWLPRSAFAFLGVVVFWILVWFLRRKLTYERTARRNKADLAAGGDGWGDWRRRTRIEQRK
jgi:hypothetical protein